MEELARRFQRIDWKNIQRQAVNVRRSTASALKDLVMTDLENKVRAATADTAWGASSSDLSIIAQSTYNREDYTLIMGIIWQRLSSSRWRCVLKGLELLKHLILFGSNRVRDEAKAAIYHLKSFENYRYVDKMTGHDHGVSIRENAQLICALLEDETLLEDYKRENSALKNKVCNSGAISSDDYMYGHGGSGGPGNRSNSLGTGRPSEYEKDDYGYDGNYQTGGDNGWRKPYDDVPDIAAKGKESGFDGFNDDNEQGAVQMKNADDLLGGSEEVLALESAEAVENQKNDGNVDMCGFIPDKKGRANDDLNDILAGIPDEALASATSSNLYEKLKINTDSGQRSSFAGNVLDDANVESSGGNLAINEKSGEKASIDAAEKESKDTDTVNTAYGGLVHFDNIMLGKGDRVEPKRPINRLNSAKEQPANPLTATSVVPPTASKEESKITKSIPKEDPFADLFSAAKKTGGL